MKESIEEVERKASKLAEEQVLWELSLKDVYVSMPDGSEEFSSKAKKRFRYYYDMLKGCMLAEGTTAPIYTTEGMMLASASAADTDGKYLFKTFMGSTTETPTRGESSTKEEFLDRQGAYIEGMARSVAKWGTRFE